MKRRRALEVLDEIGASVRDWEQHAEAAGVAPRDAARIENAFRSKLSSGR